MCFNLFVRIDLLMMVRKSVIGGSIMKIYLNLFGKCGDWLIMFGMDLKM